MASGPPWHVLRATTCVTQQRRQFNVIEIFLMYIRTMRVYICMYIYFFFHYLELMTRSISNDWKVVRFSNFFFCFSPPNRCDTYVQEQKTYITGFDGTTKKNDSTYARVYYLYTFMCNARFRVKSNNNYYHPDVDRFWGAGGLLFKNILLAVQYFGFSATFVTDTHAYNIPAEIFAGLTGLPPQIIHNNNIYARPPHNVFFSPSLSLSLSLFLNLTNTHTYTRDFRLLFALSLFLCHRVSLSISLTHYIRLISE